MGPLRSPHTPHPAARNASRRGGAAFGLRRPRSLASSSVPGSRWTITRASFVDLHKPGDVVANKYRIVEDLGNGSGGDCFVAEREEDDARVALKVLALRGMKNWKQLELFEREAKTLQNLSHPLIPKYIDHFEVDTEESGVRYYLIQEIATGTTLTERVENEGWRPSEAEVKAIAIQLLDILEYLGSLRPPVIHRDLKPDNIIIDKEDGNRIALVDFGGVQAAAPNSNSTVIGTYGYMAPE